MYTLMSRKHTPRNGSRRVKGESGQALVEIALVMPLLLVLVTAIIQFGIMLSDYSSIVNAAREGARALALGTSRTNDPCDPAVAQAISSASGDFTIPSADITPSFQSATGGATTEDYCGSSTPGTGCTPYVYNTSCNTSGAEVAGDQAEITIVYAYPLNVFGMKLFTVNLTSVSTNAVE